MRQYSTCGENAGLDKGLLVDRRNLSYRLDEGIGHRARIGLIALATDQTIEHEFRRMLNLPGVALHQTRIYNAPTITPRTLQAMESGIAAAAALILPKFPLDVMAYGCTSGAMVIGDERVRARIWESRPGLACTTPMAAAFAAFRALNAGSICLITPYEDRINRGMRAHMLENGFEAPIMGSWNLADDNKVARISEQTIADAVLDLGGSDHVDAVFVSCTNLRLADQVKALEKQLGKPVTSSNHALAWHCLRLAGCGDPIPRLGRLFTL